jgi:hypothetical protein
VRAYFSAHRNSSSAAHVANFDESLNSGIAPCSMVAETDHTLVRKIPLAGACATNVVLFLFVRRRFVFRCFCLLT